MRHLILYWDGSRYWCKGFLQEITDGKITREWFINYAYDIKDDFFYIYDAEGGSGYGYHKGEIIAKISMQNAEYSIKLMTDDIWNDYSARRYKKENA